MKFKMKLIAATVAAIGAGSAFAAPLDPTTTTPAVTFYISGASAQNVAVGLAVPSALFATPADVVKITGGNGSQGWLGKSIASLTGGTSVNLLVIYNNTNGSAAGLNQLLSTAATPTEAEAKNIKLPDATCTTNLTATPPTASCSALAPIETDMALSDVSVSEFSAGVLGTGAGFLPLTAVSEVTTGLEGFGVFVNKALYSALQAQNVLEGLLPASCNPSAPGVIVTATTTVGTPPVSIPVGDCQPSIRSADYATVATAGGAFGGSEALALVPDQPTQFVTLCRRDDLSGSQAASNIFMLNSVCGTKGFGGALTPQTDFTSSTLQVIAAANSSGGKAEACAKNAPAGTYALGWASIADKDESDTLYDGTKGFYFVKIDGASPNFPARVSSGVNIKRDGLRNGTYRFATEMKAVTRNTIASPAKDLADAFKAKIVDSTLSDLPGIAYLDAPLNWPADLKNAKFARGGNNCAPLH
jgi:hypothetical protein